MSTLHLLQALAYAGMVAKWDPKQFVDELQHFNQRWFTGSASVPQTREDATDQLEDVLEDGEIEAINRQQRIVLLAEAFDYEVLVTCEWLTERYDLDIRCYRAALAQDGDAHFLTCTRAYPPPELTEIAIRRRKKRNTGAVDAADWPEALKSVQSQAVAKFFEEERKNASRNNVKYKSLTFEVAGKRRFVVLAKRHWARVWQNGRFEDDVAFWVSRLGANGKVQALSDSRSLRFYLNSDVDFEKFKNAMRNELLGTEFSSASDDDTESSSLASE